MKCTLFLYFSKHDRRMPHVLNNKVMDDLRRVINKNLKDMNIERFDNDHLLNSYELLGKELSFINGGKEGAVSGQEPL